MEENSLRTNVEIGILGALIAYSLALFLFILFSFGLTPQSILLLILATVPLPMIIGSVGGILAFRWVYRPRRATTFWIVFISVFFSFWETLVLGAYISNIFLNEETLNIYRVVLWFALLLSGLLTVVIIVGMVRLYQIIRQSEQ